MEGQRDPGSFLTPAPACGEGMLRELEQASYFFESQLPHLQKETVTELLLCSSSEVPDAGTPQGGRLLRVLPRGDLQGLS